MLKVGQRYAYVDGSGSLTKTRFVVEVTAVTNNDRGDAKIVQVMRWGDGIGYVYHDNRLTDTNYWLLLEGQDRPVA
jgi:hypothetical protein